MNNEKWHRVTDYRDVVNGDYEISTLGRVRKNGIKLLKQTMCKRGGYPCVSLYSRKSQRTYFVTVHALIKYYIFKCLDPSVFMNHKNGIKTESTLNNLELSSAEHNTHHAIELGLFKATKITKDIVDSVRQDVEAHPYILTKADLARKYSVSKSSVTRILNGTYRRDSSAYDLSDKIYNIYSDIEKKRPVIEAMLSQGMSIRAIARCTKCDYYTIKHINDLTSTTRETINVTSKEE